MFLCTRIVVILFRPLLFKPAFWDVMFKMYCMYCKYIMVIVSGRREGWM